MNRSLLRQELIRDEGLRLTSYKDSVGLFTIGVGHLLGDKERMTTITMTECMALLETDIDEALKIAFKFCPDLFPEAAKPNIDIRARALTNMAFNLGSHLTSFVNTRAMLCAGRYEAASAAMLDSEWARQVGDRAKRIAELIKTGKEQT